MSDDMQGNMIVILILLSFLLGIFLFFKLYYLFRCGGFICLMAASVSMLMFFGTYFVESLFRLPADTVPRMVCMVLLRILSWSTPTLGVVGMLWCILRLWRVRAVQFRPAVSDERNY